MAISVARGDFLSPTTSSTDTSIVLGFQPKAMLFWGTHRGSAGTEADVSFTFGATSGLSNIRGAQVYSDEIAIGGGDTLTSAITSIVSVLRLGTSTTSNMRVATLKATTGWDTTVTLDWTSLGSTAQDYFHYLALGGDDVQATVGSIQCPAEGASTAYTGLGFAPDALLFWATTNSTSDPYTTLGASSRWCLGWATQSAQGCASHTITGEATTTDTARRQTTGHCLWMGTTTVDYLKADVSAWGSDGFTLHCTTAFATGYYVHYLALKGVSMNVGTLTQPTSPGSQSVTTTGTAPAALLLMSVGGASSASIQDGACWALGCGVSSTSRCAVTWRDEDNLEIASAGSNADTELSLSAVLKIYDGGQPVADLTSLNGEGFTLNWTTTDATAREVLYCVFGDEVGGLTASVVEITE